MPPLAVVGFGLATGKTTIAFGAGFLFMTNLLAIALSVPLGISLRDIATRSWLERSTRTEVESFLRKHDARLSSISVVAATSGPLVVDLVALTPRYEPGTVPDLKNRLTMRLREQLGAVSLDTEKRTAIVYLAPDVGLSMAEAHQLATRLTSIDPGWSVQVAPPARALPAIEFAPASSALNEVSIRDLETAAWALKRWNMTEVDVFGLASSDGPATHNLALARERAEAVATWPVSRGIASTVRPSFERRSQQPIERERGAAAFRRVEIIPVAAMKPVATASQATP